MLEHGTVKIGSAKLLGFVVAPGLALAGIGGYLIWKHWHERKASSTSEDSRGAGGGMKSHREETGKDAIFRKIIEENVALRQA